MSTERNKRNPSGKGGKQVKRFTSPKKENKRFEEKRTPKSPAKKEDRFFDKFKPKKKREDFRNEKRAKRAEKDAYFQKKREQEGNDKSFQESYAREDRRSARRERNKTKKYERSVISSKPEEEIRLNRFIANAGVCSRRKADELIAAGEILLNGQVVTELGTKVKPQEDEVKYKGEVLKLEPIVYLLLNKPKDFITTTDDPQERKTVMDLVKKASRERIYPVGRLDRNTTGLLILTNDGLLADRLAHPRNNISKIYQVELNKPFSQGDFNKMKFGLELEDGFVKPDDISYIAGSDKNIVGIQIHSGKNRIVRRMFEHLGYEIEKLDRTVYGTLTKKNLPRGKWRHLTEEELRKLKELIKE